MLHSGWRIADTSTCQDGVDGVVAEEPPKRLCIEFTRRATPEVFESLLGPPNECKDIDQAHRKREGEEIAVLRIRKTAIGGSRRRWTQSSPTGGVEGFFHNGLA